MEILSKAINQIQAFIIRLISRYRVMQRHFVLKILYRFGYKTFAARALIIQGNKVLLIKHTYQPEWYTVGGGVDRGETPMQAVERELREELGIKCLERPQLFGIYLNNYQNSNDYKVVYVIKKFKKPAKHPSSEILMSRWFDFKNLPTDINQGTLRRIEEYRGIRKIDEMW